MLFTPRCLSLSPMIRSKRRNMIQAFLGPCTWFHQMNKYMEFHGWEIGGKEMVRKGAVRIESLSRCSGKTMERDGVPWGIYSGETGIYSGNGEISNLFQTCRRGNGEKNAGKEAGRYGNLWPPSQGLTHDLVGNEWVRVGAQGCGSGPYTYNDGAVCMSKEEKGRLELLNWNGLFACMHQSPVRHKQEIAAMSIRTY